jgi:hypothetical protein
MLEEGRACEDVVTHLMAVRAAVDRAAGELVMAHIDECLARLPAEQHRATVGRTVKMLGRMGGWAAGRRAAEEFAVASDRAQAFIVATALRERETLRAADVGIAGRPGAGGAASA